METATGTLAVAIEELEQEFADVSSEPDGEGGLFVVVAGIETQGIWQPDPLPLEFRLLFNYPHAAIYPFYATPDLQLAAGGPVPQAIQRVDWRGRTMMQISLNSPNWNPKHDTALSKVKQVRRWLQTGEL
jgi:hypothetical protein